MNSTMEQCKNLTTHLGVVDSPDIEDEVESPP